MSDMNTRKNMNTRKKLVSDLSRSLSLVLVCVFIARNRLVDRDAVREPRNDFANDFI